MHVYCCYFVKGLQKGNLPTISICIPLSGLTVKPAETIEPPAVTVSAGRHLRMPGGGEAPATGGSASDRSKGFSSLSGLQQSGGSPPGVDIDAVAAMMQSRGNKFIQFNHSTVY